MNLLLVAINAKYIHMNNAVRLLKANSAFKVDFIEFTIHDDPLTIYEKIISTDTEVIGFSTYIWNIEIVRFLTNKIKAESKRIVILGGPEVSYDTKASLKETHADMIVRGEGEHALDNALRRLLLKEDTPCDNLAFYTGKSFAEYPIKPVLNLSALKSPYTYNEDAPYYKNRIAYIEASRGCPYRCSYCLASLDKPVRFFSFETVQANILYLIDQGAKTFKFLDRTFNSLPYMNSLIDFIITHHQKGMSFQFEITGDVMPKDVIDYIHAHAPAHLFRFEIGIQSTYDKTNQAVQRVQNNKKLFALIQDIVDHDIIDLHLDLMAGLPEESLERFKQTFDSVYLLNAKELQLGTLKMLKGTKLRQEAKRYNYRYQSQAPYEIIANHVLSEQDLERIKHVEKMLNLLHNKGHFGNLIYHIVATMRSPFVFFEHFYAYQEEKSFQRIGFQLDELYHLFESYLLSVDGATDWIDRLRIHYLKRAKTRPKLYFETVIDKELKTRLFEHVCKKHKVSIATLYKHALVYSALERYHVFLYQRQVSHHYSIKK